MAVHLHSTEQVFFLYELHFTTELLALLCDTFKCVAEVNVFHCNTLLNDKVKFSGSAEITYLAKISKTNTMKFLQEFCDICNRWQVRCVFRFFVTFHSTDGDSALH